MHFAGSHGFIVSHGIAFTRSVGHPAPPPEACAMMVRVLICVPAPHVAAEHGVGVDHSDTRQSTRHDGALHDIERVDCPHVASTVPGAHSGQVTERVCT